jgi:serine/threonine protein kinase
MGEVYRARDPRIGRDVAIKVLPGEFSADPDRLRRFEQEARPLAPSTTRVSWRSTMSARPTSARISFPSCSMASRCAIGCAPARFRYGK